MKKKDFITLIMSTVGGILFALGMCMALLPEWGAMMPGIVIGVIGAVVLLAMILVRRKMDGKPPCFQRESHRNHPAGRVRSHCSGGRHVHDHGVEHDDSRYRCWHRRHCSPALSDSSDQGAEVRRNRHGGS